MENDRFRCYRLIITNSYDLIFSTVSGNWCLVQPIAILAGTAGYNNLDQPTGVYIYQLEMVSAQNKRIVRQGTVTLLR